MLLFSVMIEEWGSWEKYYGHGEILHQENQRDDIYRDNRVGNREKRRKNIR
jgi:hypothetical protein